MRELTPRQERFIYEYVRTSVRSDSYIKAYGPMRREVARAGSSRLLKHPKIVKRMDEVRRRMAKRADITIEKILTDYQDALELARGQSKAGEMVVAATAQAKLVGLLRERVEAGAPGDFDQLQNISDVLEKLATEAGNETALAVAKALGIQTSTAPSVAPLEAIEPPTDAVN